jgi:hypothetical protein
MLHLPIFVVKLQTIISIIIWFRLWTAFGSPQPFFGLSLELIGKPSLRAGPAASAVPAPPECKLALDQMRLEDLRGKSVSHCLQS